MATMLDEYRAAKARHPGMVLLFRTGDYYEAYENDAVTVANALELTLNNFEKTIPMAGFPHHSLEHHLRKLLGEGIRVAVCEQEPETLKRTTRMAKSKKADAAKLCFPILVPTNVGIMYKLAAKSNTKYATEGVWFQIQESEEPNSRSYYIASTDTRVAGQLTGAQIDESECEGMEAPAGVDNGLQMPGGIISAEHWKEAFGKPSEDGLRWVLPTKAGLLVVSPEKSTTYPWIEGRFPPLDTVIKDLPKKLEAYTRLDLRHISKVADVAAHFADDDDRPIGQFSVYKKSDPVFSIETANERNKQNFFGLLVGVQL